MNFVHKKGDFITCLCEKNNSKGSITFKGQCSLCPYEMDIRCPSYCSRYKH